MPDEKLQVLESSVSEDICSRSWILVSSSPAESNAIHARVDTIFSGFSFYPEVEWAAYGYPPPDGHKVFGAWRHPDGVAFVFLLENRGMSAVTGMAQLVLSYGGKKSELELFLPQVRELKRDLVRKNGRMQNEKERQKWLERANTAHSLKGLAVIMGSVTLAINGLSLYLRKLPIPQIEGRFLLEVYKLLLSLVHISALGLFLAYTLILVLYLCKYGFFLLLRKSVR